MQAQTTRQTQMLEQNNANSMCFSALSALEAIEKMHSKQNGPKQFGAYDKYDNSHLDLAGLKQRLKISIMVLNNSKMSFDKIYGKNSYQLPKDYASDKVIQRVIKSLNFLKQFNDTQSQVLAMDIIYIMQGDYSKLRYMTLKIENLKKEVKPSSKDISNGVIGGIEQNNRENEEFQQKFGPKVSPDDLKFKLNTAYIYCHNNGPKTINQNNQQDNKIANAVKVVDVVKVVVDIQAEKGKVMKAFDKIFGLLDELWWNYKFICYSFKQQYNLTKWYNDMLQVLVLLCDGQITLKNELGNKSNFSTDFPWYKIITNKDNQFYNMVANIEIYDKINIQPIIRILIKLMENKPEQVNNKLKIQNQTKLGV